MQEVQYHKVERKDEDECMILKCYDSAIIPYSIYV